MMNIRIDTSNDFMSDSNGRDPDKYSIELRKYHQLLWSKTLPNGQLFNLEEASNNRLLYRSDLEDLYLSSDRAVTTFWKRKNFQPITSKLNIEELKEFDHITDTIGGIVIWPSNMVEKRQTINGARGFTRMISDRLDLTMESIRLYYNGEDSPLKETFDRYSTFFNLFENFEGFIDFFLLQDAVSDDYSTVHIAEPFDNFKTSPIPKNVDEFLQYKEKTIKFVNQRNERIANYALTFLQ